MAGVTGYTAVSNMPVSLRNIPNLIQIPLIEYPSGVYMLVNDGTVIYIGQSKSPMERVLSHYLRVGFDFNTAYFIPVPEHELNVVEGAFINLFEPTCNGRTPNGHMVAPNATEEERSEAVAKYYGAYVKIANPDEGG